jgi:N-acetylneuraminic acid mutarotase
MYSNDIYFLCKINKYFYNDYLLMDIMKSNKEKKKKTCKKTKRTCIHSFIQKKKDIEMIEGPVCLVNTDTMKIL